MRKRRQFIAVCIAALIILIVVITGSWIYRERTRLKTKAEDVALAQLMSISTESASRLKKLSLRFGEMDLNEITLSTLILRVKSPENAQAFENALEEIDDALAASNVAQDLSAPPQPTGDALFDRYAILVDQQINDLGYEDITEFDTAAIVPDAELAQLAGEFGADPRYWELRYFCMKHSESDSTSKKQLADPSLRNQRAAHRDKALEFLEEARESGIATANTLMLLYWEKREQLQAADPPVYEELVYEFTPEAAAELLAIADEAVAAGVDEAWPYYTRAMYWYETGQPEHGLADIETGNTQQVNRYPVPFPLHTIAKGLNDSSPAGNAAVSGVFIAVGLNVLPSPVIRKAIKATLAETKLDDDSQAYEIWHQFGCRLAESRNEDLIFGLFGLACLNNIRETALDDTSLGADDPRRETLGRMLGAREVLKKAYKDSSHGFNVISATLPLAIAGQARGPCIAIYLDTQTRECVTTDQVLPIFLELNEVHYPELVMTDALAKYENVTIEELRARREREREEAEASAEHVKQ